MAEVPPIPDDIVELGEELIGDPAFVVGCARSGTSILGEAVAAHPDAAYLFEASRIWNALVPQRDDHRLVAADADAEIAESIYRALAEARRDLPGRLLVEKNPKHVIRIPFLRALFPRARFLHIIRDGRDTIASLMFRNRGSSWGHLETPGWRDVLARYPEENHIRCAHQWRFAVAAAREDARALPTEQYHEIRYEDLVRDPRAAMAPVWSFLGLAPHPEAEDFLAKIQDETRGSYHARKQVRHYVENHSRRIGRFHENLTAEQLADIAAVCGDLLRELGYSGD